MQIHLRVHTISLEYSTCSHALRMHNHSGCLGKWPPPPIAALSFDVRGNLHKIQIKLYFRVKSIIVSINPLIFNVMFKEAASISFFLKSWMKLNTFSAVTYELKMIAAIQCPHPSTPNQPLPAWNQGWVFARCPILASWHVKFVKNTKKKDSLL